ncbi:hypothetical protein BpHYR1_022205 [Brachionus plicatilis]|uniref:Uncharacterized protein n=1 Tax=Brachionus plicatilis TaxID=10195 RepID=A0A3M7PV53_BRAPC|nr:hypothetical protein BpHYR1_022205 [Brachionus plicatilis]
MLFEGQLKPCLQNHRVNKSPQSLTYPKKKIKLLILNPVKLKTMSSFLIDEKSKKFICFPVTKKNDD